MIRAATLALLLGLAAPCAAQEAFGDPSEAPAAETWELDQLRVARDVPEATLKAIEPDHSLEAAIKTLNGLHIPFTRTHVRIDADKLPLELRTQLLALPPGEPFIIPEEQFWSISVIVGRTLPPGAVRWTPAPRRFPLSLPSPRKA